MKYLKHPNIQLRYAKGLGDLIAVFLHSRFIQPFTTLVLGKSFCHSCSIRQEALNIIIPLPVWKLFFKTQEAMQTSYNEVLISMGYTILKDGPEMVSSTINETQYQTPTQTIIDPSLISESETVVGNFRIKVSIYKK